MLPAVEIRHRTLVKLVVASHPPLQMGKLRIGIAFLNLCLVFEGKAVNGNKRILANGTATATYHIDATTRSHSLIVRLADNATVHKLTGAYTPLIPVILHL